MFRLPLTFSYWLTLYIRTEKQNEVGIDTLLPRVATSTKPLITALYDALTASTSWLEHANHSRWRPRARLPSSSRADRVQLLDKLRAELAEFKQTRRLMLIEPFSRFFDSRTGALIADVNSTRLSGRSLYVCFALQTSLCALADASIRLLERINTLEAKRTRRRLWWPRGLRHLGTLIVGGHGARAETAGIEGAQNPEAVDVLDDTTTVGGSSINSEKGNFKGKASNKKKGTPAVVDLDARTLNNALGRLRRGLYNTYMWFWSPVVGHSSAPTCFANI